MRKQCRFQFFLLYIYFDTLYMFHLATGGSSVVISKLKQGYKLKYGLPDAAGPQR